MTATIQKELADRIVARPSTKDYNALSIWMQSQSHTEIVRVLAPSVFWPRPKVTSAIIHVTVDMEMRSRISNPTYWHQFVRAMFLHRRKFFRSVVVAAFKKHLDKQQVDALMAQHGFGPTTRAEELDVPTMHAFCESVRQVAPDWSL
jgi:16S rRNA (adenine1518-N6/adenine1519-N6)-dimethyltransferase